MFGPLRALLSRDPYIKRAREDQKRAEYPQCVRGNLNCRLLCGDECPGHTYPTARFVEARAEFLRKSEVCRHRNTRPKRSAMFPSLPANGVKCMDCGMVLPEGHLIWKEDND